MPEVLITRTCPFPRWEIAAHFDDGRVFRRFETCNLMLSFMRRFGYDLIAPDTWSRA